MTDLQEAYEQAAAEKGYPFLVNVFKDTSFFVVMYPLEEGPAFYSQKLEATGNLCITVAETKEMLEGIGPHVVLPEMKGGEILRRMPDNQDILIMYPEAGQVYVKETVQRLKDLLDK